MCSRRAIQGLPVLRHADNAVFLRDDNRRAHYILESLDFAQQTWLPSLRLGLNFGRHGSVVHKPPCTLLAPGNITHPVRPQTSGQEMLAGCQQVARGVVTAARNAASQLTTHTDSHPPTEQTQSTSFQQNKTSCRSFAI